MQDNRYQEPDYEYSYYAAPPPPPPPAKKRVDWRTIVAVLLAVVGVALLSSWFVKNWIKDENTKRLLNDIDNGQTEILIENSTVDVDAPSDDGLAMEGSDDPLATPDPSASSEQFGSSDEKEGKKRSLEVLGKLKIERIGIVMPLVHGADKEALEYGVGQLRGSTPIGKEGNTVIAGHRAWKNGQQFSKLDEVQIGDLVEIITKDKHYVYRVTKTQIVEPGDERYYAARDGKFQVTLFTCHPKVTSTYRLIKVCDLVNVTDKDGNELPMPTPDPSATKKPRSTVEPVTEDAMTDTAKPTATPKPSKSAQPSDAGDAGGEGEDDAPNAEEGVPGGSLGGDGDGGEDQVVVPMD